jgi:uncharacterized membrane protein
MTLLLPLLLACGEDPVTEDSVADPCDSAYPVTWANWAEGFFTNYCRACHSSGTAERYGAPEGVDFDTLDDVLRWRERIEIRTLEMQDMPVGGGVYEEDLELLRVWLDCELSEDL